MGMEYYLFALFVFALSVILIVIIIYGTRKNKAKEDRERAKKEEKLMMMYFEVEDMIESLKEYVDVSRDKIEGDIRRIETDMQALATVKESLFILQENIQNSINITQNIEQSGADEEPAQKVNENLTRESEPAAPSRHRMLRTEKDVEDMAKELNRSRSEVALMMKMKKLTNSEFLQEN